MGKPLHVDIGQRFGRLTVIETHGLRIGGCTAARVRCECGTVKLIRRRYLISGRTRSCGCLSRETAAVTGRAHGRVNGRAGAKKLAIHGLWKHYLYKTHNGMMHRCYNPRCKEYANYGGRGIRVYEPWHDVATFVAWIEEHLGPRPDGHSLDRIDNDGAGYFPGNVRWADAKTQANNTRRQLKAA